MSTFSGSATTDAASPAMTYTRSSSCSAGRGKQDVPGEGMGLAYVKALVRRHGRAASGANPEPGAGTTFSFTIPGTRETAL